MHPAISKVDTPSNILLRDFNLFSGNIPGALGFHAISNPFGGETNPERAYWHLPSISQL